MAIDSELKRKSIAAIGLYVIGATALPSGTFDQAQRQAVGYGYSGILAGEPVIPVVPTVNAPAERTLQVMREYRGVQVGKESRNTTIHTDNREITVR